MRELIITGFRMWRESLLRWFRHCDSSHPARAIAMLILRKVSNLVHCLTVSRYKTWLDNGYELLRIPLEGKKRGRTCLIFRDRYSFGGWHTTIFTKREQIWARFVQLLPTLPLRFASQKQVTSQKMRVLLTECMYFQSKLADETIVQTADPDLPAPVPQQRSKSLTRLELPETINEILHEHNLRYCVPSSTAC